jgi:HAD superfamily hydrolase (TIGR01509 family)
MSDIKGVWFDLDGTLFDHRAAADQALAKVHEIDPAVRIVPFARWRDAFHRRNAECWDAATEGRMDQETIRSERFRMTLRDVGIMSPELANRCNSLYLGIYPWQPTPVPGAVDAVEAARSAGIKVGVLTNGFAQIQRRKLSAIGFEDIDVFVSEDVGVMKPDTGIFDVAAEQMALSPQSLLMVGNRYDSDVIGGNAAGWRTVWLNDPAMDIPDDSAANLVLSNSDDLPKLFAVGQA